MRVAIASSRHPKVQATKNTFQRLASLLAVEPAHIHYLTKEIGSGVAETPTTLERLLTGARNRAVQGYL